MSKTIRLKAALAALSFCCLSFTFIRSGALEWSEPGGGNDQPVTGLRPETEETGAKPTDVATIVTKALYFKSLLTTTQQGTLQQAYTSMLAKNWSNLPCGSGCRNGIQLSTLTSAQLGAALSMIREAAGTVANDGYDELQQIRLADEILQATAGGTTYDSGNYYVSFLNTPSTTGAWMLQYGGHHYAANIAFNGGNVIGTTPQFEGVEPVSFVSNGTTYTPLTDEHDALTAMLASLSSTQLGTAHLSATFNDVTLAPGETNGGSGTFPGTKVGLSCSGLSTAQKNLVLAAIQHWVQDVDPVSAATLMSIYTSEINNTYIAYTGSTTAGSASNFLNANGNYARIDGTSVWVEFVCQNGVVFSGIHYHSVWRDHTRDYGNNLTNTALPVTLVSFSAEGSSGGNLVSWRTGSETNASHFEVERTGDPTGDFQSLATVKAKGLPSSTYSFTDREVAATGTVYYRLKCVDWSGDVRYSQVVPVRASGPVRLQVYPNPAAEVLTASIPATLNEATVTLVEPASGRTSVLGKYKVAGNLQLNIASVAPGNYLLVIEDGTSRYASGFTKR